MPVALLPQEWLGGIVAASAIVAAVVWAGWPGRADGAEAAGFSPQSSLRLRIEWGGPAEELWQGLIAVSQGTLSDPVALGIEADEPGSMWLDRGPVFALPAAEQNGTPTAGPDLDQLVIRQRSPRTYDGVDLLVTAPLEAKLLVVLWPQGSRAQPQWITIPLADVLHQRRAVGLDERGNRLSVGRAPGDSLRVTLDRRSLVFAPGERFTLTVRPNLLDADPGSKLRLKIELCSGREDRGEVVAEHMLIAGEEAPIEQQVQLPQAEGVYDLVLTVLHAPLVRLPSPVRVKQPLAIKPPVATRRVQLVVLSPNPPVRPEGSGSQLSIVEEIDPAHPWWERFAKLPRPRRLPRLWKGPLGNGLSRTRQHPLGELVELGPSPNPDDVAWEAYTLPIEEPGRPHLLEVDYPSDVAQTMGISIIEPNAAGAVLPLGLDSGVDVAEEVAPDASEPQWLKHRVIFWPKTKSPLVLVTDRRDNSPAVYGKIRVLAFGTHLPPFPAPPAPPERLMAAYLDRPLLPESLCADQAIVASSQLAVDDWVTFYQSGTRLVEYLRHVGYGGLMMSVLADGSTVYPSAMLQPTPRYDMGAFQDQGQDPLRKDVLEMLLRLFDREQLALIPALDFSTPLAELEAELRRGGPDTEGMRWIGPDGKSWLEARGPVRGMAPYYNVLHPRVQKAMLATVRELVERYKGHRSLAGVAIQLSAFGYAQLPGPEWGMDDATIARFRQDTTIQVPGEGPGRYGERARFLAAQSSREWLDWRAIQLSQFYHRIYGELAAACPQGRLYLAGANMLSGPELRRELKPALPREMAIGEAMLRVGIDARHFAQDRGIVLLRPERIAPQWSLARQAVSLEIQQMLRIEQKQDMKLPFEGLPVPGSLFFHEPQGVRVASFDARSPFQPCSNTWLATQPVPSSWQNRRRIVQSLAALDSQVMFDGGWQLSLGQEDWLRDVVAAYRQLPAVPFQRLTDRLGSDQAQPLSIRYASHAGASYVYIVNEAPFTTAARIEVACPAGCRIEELSGLRQVPPLRQDADGTYWTVELGPYDLVAVRLTSPQVTLSQPQAHWPPEVQARLKRMIDAVKERAATLSYSPPLLQVLDNPDFEQPAGPDGRIPGWTVASLDGSAVEGSAVGLDTTEHHGGGQSVRLGSRGPGVSLISQPFEPPTTGRLTMAVWLRASESTPPPTVRYRLEGWLEDKTPPEPFVRWQVRQVGPQWGPFIVEAADLPLQGLSPLRICFDLTGPGEVWIDDVQLCALVFNQAERNALLKLIAPADLKLQRGQVRDCIELLEGYWPRFLLANVPAAPPAVARASQPPPQSPQPREESRGVLERMKALVPKRVRSLF